MEGVTRKRRRVQAADYTSLDAREHILLRPDTYVGAVHPLEHSDVVCDVGGTRREVVVNVSPAYMKLVDELLTNASDNALRALKAGDPPGTLGVAVDDVSGKITVRNGGAPIPVEMHPTENCQVLELIFSKLRTSSNFNDDEERLGGGRNGYGAKLCNVFSTAFSATTADDTVGKICTQRWEHNMTVCHPPEISDLPVGTEPYVTVEFLPDWARLGVGAQDTVWRGLVCRMVLDYTFAIQLPVTYNGTDVGVVDACTYLRSFGDDPKTVVHYTSDERTAVGLPRVTFAVSLHSGRRAVSFVNGVRTLDGGVHVEPVWRQFTAAIQKRFPGTHPADVRQHFFLVLAASVENPEFNSQQKREMTGPSRAVRPPPARVWDPLLNDPAVEAVFGALAISRRQPPAASTPSLADVGCIEDAEWAGHRAHWAGTVALLVEGGSAQAYAEELITRLPDARKRYGILTNRGKLPNTQDTDKDHDSDRTVATLRAMLGADAAPRYGAVWLMSDQDDDGRHINTLALAVLERYYPVMLRDGRVFVYESPLIRVDVRDKLERVFYDIEPYDTWRAANPQRQVHTRYMKGLGNASADDIDYDAAHLRLLRVAYDGPGALQRHLAPDHAATRRVMLTAALAGGLPPPRPLEQTVVKVSEYVARDAMIAAITTVHRHLPGVDGLKHSLRKIVWALLSRWAPARKAENGIGRGVLPAIKLSQLAGYISETIGYHHGEDALMRAMTHLACPLWFVNNYPLAKGTGRLGSAVRGLQKLTQPRYLTISPAAILEVLFCPADVPLLTRRMVEDTLAEPDFLLPVLPLQLVNGVVGIAYGYAVHMVPYDLRTVVDWLVARMGDCTTPLLRPHYRGFRGQMHLVNSRTYGAWRGRDLLADGEPVVAEFEGMWYVTSSTTTTIDMCITSLPPATLVCHLKARLTDLRDRKVIAGFSDDSGKSLRINVHKLVLSLAHARQGGSRCSADYPGNLHGVPVLLKLRCALATDPIVHLGAAGDVVPHNTPEQLMEYFYCFRLPFYDRRLALLRADAARQLETAEMRLRLLRGVTDKRIDVHAPEARVREQLAREDVTWEIYQPARISALTKEAGERTAASTLKHRAEVARLAELTAKDLWKADLVRVVEFISSEAP